jgi:ADP-ribose pyrophosphatase YjhB (NUDIX family)
MAGKKKNNEARGTMTLDMAMADLASRFVVNCPSEEQESIDRCMWQVEAAHWFYEDMYRRHHRDLPFLNFKDFTMAFFKECPAMMNQSEEAIARSVNLFQKYKRKVPVCGAIMLNTAMTKCVLVKAWGKCSAWSFPKGKINQDESKWECAIREVEEETGFNCSEHVNPQDYLELSVRQQTIRLYIATGVPEDVNFKTQTRKEIGDIQWLPLDGLRNGSVVLEQGKSKQNRSDVDGAFFTGGAFLEPLIEWIEVNRGPEVITATSKTRKNRSRTAKPQSSESECTHSASDSESSSKKKSRKKKASKADNKQNGVQTFGVNTKSGWSVEEMFAVNEAKFGIVNSYDESLYTTKLPEEYLQQKQASKNRRRANSSPVVRPQAAPTPPTAPPMPTALPANAIFYSAEQALAPSCTNMLSSTLLTRCADAASCTNPTTTTTTTNLSSAPSLPDFSFNRDEILSCF